MSAEERRTMQFEILRVCPVWARMTSRPVRDLEPSLAAWVYLEEIPSACGGRGFELTPEGLADLQKLHLEFSGGFGVPGCCEHMGRLIE